MTHATSLALLLLSASPSFSAPAARSAPALTPISFQVQSASALGLGAVSWSREQPRLSGLPLHLLGRGEFGVVFVHPADPSLTVKMMADNVDSPYRTIAGHRSRQDMDLDAREEAKGAALLAQAGAGPRLTAVTRIPHRAAPLLRRLAAWFGASEPDFGRPALVKERVFGEHLDNLYDAGPPLPGHQRMVLDLARRIDDAGLVASDLRPANIMIGTTAADPVQKAWLVDSGHVSRKYAGR